MKKDKPPKPLTVIKEYVEILQRDHKPGMIIPKWIKTFNEEDIRNMMEGLVLMQECAIIKTLIPEF